MSLVDSAELELAVLYCDVINAQIVSIAKCWLAFKKGVNLYFVRTPHLSSAKIIRRGLEQATMEAEQVAL